MRKIDLQASSSSFPTQPKKGVILMITRRIFWALMITAMMLTSTTAVKAQWVSRADLMRLSKGGDGTQVTSVRETIVPIMNTSPWAKLISSMIP